MSVAAPRPGILGHPIVVALSDQLSVYRDTVARLERERARLERELDRAYLRERHGAEWLAERDADDLAARLTGDLEAADSAAWAAAGALPDIVPDPAAMWPRPTLQGARS